VQLAQVHQVVDAGEEEPLATAQAADQRVVERARLRFVAGDRLGRGGERAAALGQQEEQLLTVGIRRTRDARHDLRRVGRPLAACRERRGVGEPAA